VYSSHLRAFLAFCQLINVCPVPASSVTLCRFVAYLARFKALASIQQCLNVVRLVHMNLGYPNPVAGCHQLQAVLTGIKRVKGTAAAYKLPFNPSHLTAIKSHLNLTCVVNAC
jgi:hypothetical protein